MKKKLLFALSTTSIVAAAAIALAPKVSSASFAEGCEHEGNHYGAVAATCSSAGNVEFWACCVCHEQFLSQPDKGTWSDLGAYAGPALSPSHVAYLAPSHSGSSSYSVAKTGNNLEVVESCDDCGESVGGTGVTATLPAASTATWTMNDVSGKTTYPWAYDEATGVYSSTNQKKDSTCSLMELTVTGAGTIAMDITIVCEANYDYLTIYKNSSITNWTYSNATNNANGKVYTTYGHGSSLYKESVAIDVEVGDVITFARRKDTSSSTGDDVATVKFNQAATYGLVNYDSKGGSSVVPGITINGCVVTELPTPTKDGYVFDGWYKSEAYADGDEVVQDTFVGDNSTVYAKWWDASQRHQLEGTYKGFGFKANASRTGISILTNATLTVNFKGEVTCDNAYWYSTAKKMTSYADGAGTMGDVAFEYDEATGTIVTHKNNLSDDYGYIFVKDSTQMYTSTLVKNCGYGNATDGTFAVYSYPLADGTIKYFHANGQTGEVVLNVTATPLRPVTIANAEALGTKSGENATGGFRVTDSDGAVVATVGYDGSGFGPVAANSYYGVYDNSVTGDTKVSKIYYTGDKRMYVNSEYSAKTVTIENNVLSYSSGHDAEQYTLDVENASFVRSVPTITITYNLNGHEGVLVDGSGAFKLNENTQLACSAGAWLYESDLAKFENNKSTDGLYVFEGWYLEAECTNIFSRNNPTTDFTLYAKWTRLYTITLVQNNGDDDRVVEVKEGNTPSFTDPRKEGYMFAGWYTDEECTEPYTPATCTGDQTLYAKWVEQPNWAKGKYQGYNCCSTNYNKECSASSYYGVEFNTAGRILKNGSDIGGYSATSDISTGVLEVASGKYMGISNEYNNRRVIASHYSGPTADAVPGDILFAVQTYSGETAKFKQTTLVANSAYLIEITITGSENAGTFVAYVDCDNNKIYLGVDLSVTRGETTTSAFADVYASTFADSIVISLNGATVGVWGKNGSTAKRGDTYAGSYAGSFNGVSGTLVLNGFGTATFGDQTGTYTGSGDVVTVVIGGNTYQVTVSGGTFSQILDGYEGTYTGANGDLVVTGYGVCTLGGEAATYTIVSDNLLRVDVAGAVSFLTVDKTAGTYVAATASPFSGLTFTGTGVDVWGDPDTLKIEFDDGAAITGRVLFSGNASYKAEFTGSVSGTVLTITFTSDVTGWSGQLVGKTATFDLADGQMTCTSYPSGAKYQIPVGTVVSNASFVAPVGGETPDPEVPQVNPLTAGTYTASVTDLYGAGLTYVFVVNSDLTSGTILSVNDDEPLPVIISESDNSDFQYMVKGVVSIYFNVNSDGSLEVTVDEDYYNYVSGTFTMVKE